MIDSVDAGVIARIPTGAASFRERFKRPYIVIHRVDLHRVLLDACEKEANVELVPLTERGLLRGPWAITCGCGPPTTAPSKARR